MSFSDIFKRSFLSGFVTSELTMKSIAFAIGITCLFSLYLFIVYRLVTRKTFYDKNMDIALAVIPVITCAIVLTIQSNVVISLGMVGALSIVRFRTAVKSPLDLVFLFWAISIGIICGAGLPGIAFVLCIIVTVGILALNLLPVAKAPVLLIVNGAEPALRQAVLEAVKENTTVYTVKSQTVEVSRLSMIIEVRPKTEDALIGAVSAIPGITRCSLVNHDGEVTF